MLNFISSIFNKIKLLKISKFKNISSQIITSNSIKVFTKSNSQIIINKGVLQIGGSFPKLVQMPSYNQTVICLEENSSIEVFGDVFIAEGTYINVKKNAKLVFLGGNFIGHNSKIICSNLIKFGKNTSSSWNTTLIDHDGHDLYKPNGEKVNRRYPPLILEDFVGLQMNVTIPHGIKIGARSLIGANTVVRNDIPKDTLAYATHQLRIKNEISAGLQFIE